MEGRERRRDGKGPVSRDELRLVELHWQERWRRLEPLLGFLEEMQELGLRELLPVLLAEARVRQGMAILREGRYRWAVRLGAYLFILSLAVGTVGGSIAIARTLHWIR